MFRKKQKNTINMPIKKGIDEHGNQCMYVCQYILDASKPIALKQVPSDVVSMELSYCKRYLCLYIKQSIDNIEEYV